MKKPSNFITSTSFLLEVVLLSSTFSFVVLFSVRATIKIRSVPVTVRLMNAALNAGDVYFALRVWADLTSESAPDRFPTIGTISHLTLYLDSIHSTLLHAHFNSSLRLFNALVSLRRKLAMESIEICTTTIQAASSCVKMISRSINAQSKKKQKKLSVPFIPDDITPALRFADETSMAQFAPHIEQLCLEMAVDVLCHISSPDVSSFFFS